MIFRARVAVATCIVTALILAGCAPLGGGTNQAADPVPTEASVAETTPESTPTPTVPSGSWADDAVLTVKTPEAFAGYTLNVAFDIQAVASTIEAGISLGTSDIYLGPSASRATLTNTTPGRPFPLNYDHPTLELVGFYTADSGICGVLQAGMKLDAVTDGCLIQLGVADLSSADQIEPGGELALSFVQHFRPVASVPDADAQRIRDIGGDPAALLLAWRNSSSTSTGLYFDGACRYPLSGSGDADDQVFAKQKDVAVTCTPRWG